MIENSGSFAERFVNRWVNDLTPCYDEATWAQEIDPRCRVEGFLYTKHKRFIFSDGSKARLSNGCLTVET